MAMPDLTAALGRTLVGGEPPTPSPVSALSELPRPAALSIEAEILPDAVSGRPELLMATDGWNYDSVTADELRARIAAAQAELDRLARLADFYEAMSGLLRPPATA